MSLSFQNRIAFHYMIATAVIMAVVFSFVNFVVQRTVYFNLDTDLAFEAHKHTKEIQFMGDSIHFINKSEWEEHEHREIQVNPVFIQLVDQQGRLMDKSPNLKSDFLPFQAKDSGRYLNTYLGGRAIRQVQLPVENQGKTKGYILAAMSFEAAQSVMQKLRNVLLLSYLFVLIGLYFVSRFLAGRSIIPIQDMTTTIHRITRNNLNERVKLPQHKDELYELSEGFNELLQRIENAIIRERQFTSDASHELRTPLATLRGTLEVLIRKPRTQSEYEDKVNYSLSEIDRMTATIEQLLTLARLDEQAKIQHGAVVPLTTLINEALTRQNQVIQHKNLRIDFTVTTGQAALVPQYYANLVMENIISNAIKYSGEETLITIVVQQENGRLKCSVQDQGIGIKAEDLSQIFNNFFRSNALEHRQIKGNGLGLSIAKKAADAIHAQIQVVSTPHNGTTFTIIF